MLKKAFLNSASARMPVTTLGLLCSLSGLMKPAWGQALQAAPSGQSEHAVYSQVFPFHVEYAAMTQIKPFGQKAGGPGGHAFLYIHGLCKDYSVPYPKVIPCSEAKFPPGLEHSGVGISVNNDFVNANWVAVPGHELFFKGIVPNGNVDAAAIQAVEDAAIRYRIFEGVQVKPALVSTRQRGQERYTRQVAKNAIGTDFAAQFGRELWGVRFRVDQKAIPEMAKFLNAVNEPYVMGVKPYEWSGIYDNCAMLSANVLAQACVRKSIPTRQIWIRQLFHLALPRNGLSTLQSLVHEGGRGAIARAVFPEVSAVDFDVVMNNPIWRENLRRFGTLPVGLGALSRHYPTFKGDALFADDLAVAQIPHVIPGANRRSKDYFNIPEFSQLGSQHLHHWETELQQARLQVQDVDLPERDKMRYLMWVNQELREVARVQRLIQGGPCPAIWGGK